jgi:hypothetical protein
VVQPGAVILNSIPVAFNGVRRSQMEALRLTIGLWRVCWPVVADSHHFDEEPNPHPQSGKSEPYSHLKSRIRICIKVNSGKSPLPY